MYAKGNLPKPEEQDPVGLAAKAWGNESIKSAREAVAAFKSQQNRAEQLAFTLVEQAAIAAQDGSVETAREMVAKAAAGTTNPTLLSIAGEFYEATGDLPSAETMRRRSLAVGGEASPTLMTAAAYANLGNVLVDQRKFDEAVAMYTRAAAIFEQIGRQRDQAQMNDSLGNVFYALRNWDQAVSRYEEAIRLYEDRGLDVDAERTRQALAQIEKERPQVPAGRGVPITVEWLSARLLAMGYPVPEVASYCRRAIDDLAQASILDQEDAGRFLRDAETQKVLSEYYEKYLGRQQSRRATAPLVDVNGLFLWGPRIHLARQQKRLLVLADLAETLKRYRSAGWD
jgi:tetratricopeptide (TPR) repeat protein